MDSIAALILNLGQKAKKASRSLRTIDTETKNAVLHNIASNIQKNQKAILDANKKDLTLGKNTFIEGRVETDERGFELTFNSPEIKFQEYFVNNINVTVDNSNPLFNICSVQKFTARIIQEKNSGVQRPKGAVRTR